MTITIWGAVIIAILVGILAFRLGATFTLGRVQTRMSMQIKAEDVEDRIQRAVADAVFLNALKMLYSDEHADINGGDLVEAIGFWANDQHWLAIAELQAMGPDMGEERS